MGLIAAVASKGTGGLASERYRAILFAVVQALSASSASTAHRSIFAEATPDANANSANSDLSVAAAVTNLGSNFLERLGNQASYGFGGALRNNPAGGGASEATRCARRTEAGARLRNLGKERAAGQFRRRPALGPGAASRD